MYSSLITFLGLLSWFICLASSVRCKLLVFAIDCWEVRPDPICPSKFLLRFEFWYDLIAVEFARVFSSDMFCIYVGFFIGEARGECSTTTPFFYQPSSRCFTSGEDSGLTPSKPPTALLLSMSDLFRTSKTSEWDLVPLCSISLLVLFAVFYISTRDSAMQSSIVATESWS